MQKKIIALAVAGLVSGAAFAQSNVVISGIADMAYQYSGKSFNANTKAKSAFNDGGQDASRVTFSGTEDLGNGLSAFFALEQGFNLDTATSAGRNSNVGLKGANWGTIKLGSFGSVHDDYNGYSEAGSMGWGNGVVHGLGTGDARNAVEYISPNFNGLEFKLGASTQYGQGTSGEVEAVTNGNNNNRAVFGAVAYVNGGLKLAASYDRSKLQTAAPGVQAANEYMLAASYNFGPVAAGLGFDRTKQSDADVRKSWRVTIGAPIGAVDHIGVSYSRATFDSAVAGVADGKASGWGLGYWHAMSKRTNLYASYGQMTQNDEMQAGNNAAIDGSYERAFKVGIRHFF